MKSLFALLLFCSALLANEPVLNGLHTTRFEPYPAEKAAKEDLPRLLFREQLVCSMGNFLWPKADGSLTLGPVDGTYYAPTKAEIEDLLRFVAARRELLPYIPEAWDCDNFATEFYYWSQVWSVRHTHAAPIAVAVGVAYVKLDGPYQLFRGEPYVQGVYHAINVILRNDGQWFFVEPQNGNIVPIEGSIYEGAIEVVKIAI